MNVDTWLEFVRPFGITCGLCGNTGILDTRGKVNDSNGADCGVRACCICPNGRTIKAHGLPLSEGDPA